MQITKAKVVAALTFVVGLINAIMVPISQIDTSTKEGVAIGSAGVVLAALGYVLAQLGVEVKQAATQAAATWHVIANMNAPQVPACDCGKHLKAVPGPGDAS